MSGDRTGGEAGGFYQVPEETQTDRCRSGQLGEVSKEKLQLPPPANDVFNFSGFFPCVKSWGPGWGPEAGRGG